MRKDNFTAPYGIRWVAGFAFALAIATVIALTHVSVANAQTQKKSGSDGQYKVLVAPSGPAAGETCSDVDDNNGNGLFDAGDLATFPGDFSVASGASVVIDDEDGTQGTFIDGENAEITGENGDIVISVTGQPLNVAGGDGALGTEVCSSIVSTTGISGGYGSQDVSVSVLPDTGGSMFVLYGSVLVAAGVGLALVRRRFLSHS